MMLLAREKKIKGESEKTKSIRKEWKFLQKIHGTRKEKKVKAYQYRKDSSEKTQQPPHK